ncbi:MAG TPA: type II secretion system F family protein [Actinomycetota bacterium]|nr:type II secretion system F family protein [Actinomycetota bacterium]
MPGAAWLAAVLAALGVAAFALSVRIAMAPSPIDALVSSAHPRLWSRPRRGVRGAPPTIWIPIVSSRRAARAKAALDAEVPQLLDLLAAGSSAGLSAPLALRRAAEALRGPLGVELAAAFTAVDLGARWRDELAALAERLDSDDLRRAVAVLVRTEVLGSSLVVATRDLEVDVRRARRAAVAELARAAPVKMLFPLVFLVLPAFLLLTVVPVLLTTLRSIG